MTDYRYSQLRPLSHNVTSKPKEIAQDKTVHLKTGGTGGTGGTFSMNQGEDLISINPIEITNHCSRQAGCAPVTGTANSPALYSVV
jgi:hypothetical protein